MLKTSPILSPELLDRLRPHGQERSLQAGELLIQEGEPTYHFYVVLAGQLKVTKRFGAEEKLLAIQTSGQFTGDLALIIGKPSTATIQAIETSQVLEIAPKAFKQVMAQSSQEAAVVLAALAGRARETEILLRQQEKLAALGRLSAGLAHELNNPAAAGQRASKLLRESIVSIQGRLLKLCDQLFPDGQRELILQLQSEAVAYSASAPVLDPLTQSDREDALTDWLDQHGIASGWKLAPTLVAGGIDETRLEELAAALSPEALAEALNWLTETLTLAGLVNELEHSTSRISQLVKAIKSYSYMDQAPLQEIDIHEGLENTLMILNHKLKYGITVEREYAPALPKIQAYGSELNQVWTNLLDNAVYALKQEAKRRSEQGEPFNPTIRIRTLQLDDQIEIEIIDNAAGIPPEVQNRMFEPFFTTKGMGEGSGLGLDIVQRIIVQRHHGDIRVASQPGETRFTIDLPIHHPTEGGSCAVVCELDEPGEPTATRPQT